MTSSYYKPCPELTKCNELIEKYYKTQQYQKCFEGHLELAKLGYPLAQCQVGYFYYLGLGIKKDDHEAFSWTQKAALNGDRDAQYNLGEFYEEGIIITKDLVKARYWYHQAAKQQQAEAILKLKKQ